MAEPGDRVKITAAKEAVEGTLMPTEDSDSIFVKLKNGYNIGIDKKSIKKLLKHELAVLAKEVPDPRRFGVVVKAKNGRLLELVEKPENPKSNLALTGVKILDERIFLYPAERHKNGELYVTDSVAKLAQDHRVIVEEADTWLSIATPEDLKRINENYKAHKRKS